ncbi:MAG: ATP-dependent Clp protease ATP-binding subunit, partial [Flavobacteriales bacterium]|nr:ATP-dependent Clp protease ATP-binding subunit [Flavobacteriales bacterium]
VRMKPYSIILLYEIEKAHPDVFNILLQALDDGQMTDSAGRKINFKNTIIIMTSNIGARQLKDFGQGVGFSTSAKKKSADDHSSGVIQNALKKAFAPEFLNRIDDVVIFNSLEKDDIHKIIDIELKSLFGRIEELGYYINLTQEAKDYIADKGYDSAYGARPLKRAIQKYLEDPLAEEIIQSKVVEGSIINVTFDDVTEELIFSIKNPKKKKEDSEPKKED